MFTRNGMVHRMNRVLIFITFYLLGCILVLLVDPSLFERPQNAYLDFTGFIY
jgi:hypothetical protein